MERTIAIIGLLNFFMLVMIWVSLNRNQIQVSWKRTRRALSKWF